MKPWIAENIPPAMPPNDAPIANASSLTLRVLMPIARAATSSSRIASHARPSRESCSAQVDHDHGDQNEEQEVVVLDRAGEIEAGERLVGLEIEAADAERDRSA